MKEIFGYILMLVSYVILALSTITWVGRGIYQLFKTDYGFWSILFTNAGGWAASMIVGFILLFVGYVLTD